MRGDVVLLAMVLGVSLLPVAAADHRSELRTWTQDEMIASYLGYGGDALFRDHPTLLIVRQTVSARLQTTPVDQMPTAELHTYLALLQHLEHFEGSYRGLPTVGRNNITRAIEDVRALHEEIVDWDAPAVGNVLPSVRVATQDLLLDHVMRADRFADASHERNTAHRVAILRTAVPAAEAADDLVLYARLDAKLREEQKRYDDEVVWSLDQLDDADRLVGERGEVSVLGPSASFYYARLGTLQPILSRAEALLTVNGEEDDAARARALQDDVDETKARFLGHVAWQSSLLVLLLALAAWRTSHRLVRWADDLRRARGGDELVRRSGP